MLGAAGAWWLSGHSSPAERMSLAGGYLMLAPALLGVVFAALAMVVALMSERYMALLRESGGSDGVIAFLTAYLTVRWQFDRDEVRRTEEKQAAAETVLMAVTALAYNTDLIRIPVVVTPQVWIITMVLAVVFALAAHAVVQWRIHRMDYLEALKVKE